MDLIVEFRRRHGAGKESDRVEFPCLGIDLRENGGDSIVGGVSLKSYTILRHEVDEDRSACKGLFEGLKGQLAFRSPLEDGVLLSGVIHGPTDVRVSVNEPPIEVSKAKERLNVADGVRSWPGANGGGFSGVHG
jgi:hypothetical protein